MRFRQLWKCDGLGVLCCFSNWVHFAPKQKKRKWLRYSSADVFTSCLNAVPKHCFSIYKSRLMYKPDKSETQATLCKINEQRTNNELYKDDQTKTITCRNLSMAFKRHDKSCSITWTVHTPGRFQGFVLDMWYHLHDLTSVYSGSSFSFKQTVLWKKKHSGKYLRH